MNYQDIPLADEERRLCLEAFHSSDSVEAIWKAARHYYTITHQRRNTNMIHHPSGDGEMPLTDYELAFCRHLVKRSKSIETDPEIDKISDGWTYWEIRKGKTWADIDNAIWGKISD
jgi:hypothetical protein